MLRVGLLVNPVAGIGGPVGLKGSDGVELQAEALARGAVEQAEARAAKFLQALAELAPQVHSQVTWLSWGGVMGAQVLGGAGIAHTVLGHADTPSSGADTRRACRAMLAAQMDLLVFVGGDGTARDVLAALGQAVPVLGIPAGVKMHSGVFAVSPRAGAVVLGRLLNGQLVTPVEREVRDFDAQKDDGIAVRTFGTLRVPEAGGYLQQTKVGGRESEPLAVEEIVAHVVEQVDRSRPLVMGPGSTCERIKQALGIDAPTLRGVDVLLPGGGVLLDVAARDLEGLTAPRLIVSFTRQQGFLFGRGNQQLSAGFLSSLEWPDDVLVVGTRTKLASCAGRPLLVDTADDALDQRLSGLVEIVAGFEDTLLYRVAAPV